MRDKVKDHVDENLDAEEDEPKHHREEKGPSHATATAVVRAGPHRPSG